MVQSIRLAWWMVPVLMKSPWSSLNVVLTICLVIALLVGLGAVSEGVSHAFQQTGRSDRILVLSRGAGWEGSSFIPPDVAARVLTTAGIVRSKDGVIGAGEVLSTTILTQRNSGLPANEPVRGTSRIDQLRPEIQIIRGNGFTPGRREVIVGQRLVGKMAGAEIGEAVLIRSSMWDVVGEFSSGDIHESTLLTDAATLMSHIDSNAFNSVLALVGNKADVDDIAQRLQESTKISVVVWRESDYHAMFDALLPHLRLLTLIVGGCMLLTACVCVVHVVLSMVESRKREFAVMKCIGFSRGCIYGSLLADVLILSISGATFGALLAWLVADGATFSFGVDYYAVVASVDIDLSAIGVGVACGIIIGLAGAALPAWRATAVTSTQVHTAT